MSKITLNIEDFKTLASETRLDILRAIDQKNINLKDISHVTKLHETTIHEHLTKLVKSGFVKKNERTGHKWVYYNLSWKGSSLLHPDNTKVVVMFTTTFVILIGGIFGMLNVLRIFDNSVVKSTFSSDQIVSDAGVSSVFLSLTFICFIIFCILIIVSIWMFRKNKLVKL